MPPSWRCPGSATHARRTRQSSGVGRSSGLTEQTAQEPAGVRARSTREQRVKGSLRPRMRQAQANPALRHEAATTQSVEALTEQHMEGHAWRQRYRSAEVERRKFKAQGFRAHRSARAVMPSKAKLRRGRRASVAPASSTYSRAKETSPVARVVRTVHQESSGEEYAE